MSVFLAIISGPVHTKQGETCFTLLIVYTLAVLKTAHHSSMSIPPFSLLADAKALNFSV